MWENLTDEELVRRTFNFSQGARGETSQDLTPELTRRLMVSIRDLNKSTERYSKILVWLTIILAALAVAQIILLIRSE
ncbi:MAG: hypothetical protein HYX79_03110 [Chloroflexi bacterium]|nr:hypothetical protein [Chloroflexota bacterium]